MGDRNAGEEGRVIARSCPFKLQLLIAVCSCRECRGFKRERRKAGQRPGAYHVAVDQSIDCLVAIKSSRVTAHEAKIKTQDGYSPPALKPEIT